MSRLENGTAVDRYVVEAFLGEGGIARVYQVRHAQLGTTHALKMLSVRSPSLTQRLVREGRIQASLRHPSVVSVTDIVQHDGFTGLLMELVEGEGLDALLGRHGVLPPRLGLEIFRQVLVGVTAAHDGGVLHRDLKPGNILLEPREGGAVARVLDFGIAKVSVGADAGQTQQSDLMGTPGYMAPEQADDPSAVDARADVFSLGAVLYCLLAGRPPFPPSSIPALLQAARSGGFEPLAEAAPHVAPAVARVVERCLEPDPEARFPDCRALAEALFPGGAAAFEAEVSGAAPSLLSLPGSTPTLTDTAERGRPDTFVLPDGERGGLPTAVHLDTPEPDPGPSGKWIFIGTASLVVCTLAWLLFQTWSETGSVVPDPDRAQAVLDAREATKPEKDDAEAAPASASPIPVAEEPLEEGSVDPGLDEGRPSSSPLVLDGLAPTPTTSEDAGAPPVPASPSPTSLGTRSDGASDADASVAAPGADATVAQPGDAPAEAVALAVVEPAETRAVEEPGVAAEPPSEASPPAPAVELRGTWTGKLGGRPLTLRVVEAGAGGIRAELDVLQGTTFRTFEMRGPGVGAEQQLQLTEAGGEGWRLEGRVEGGAIRGTVAAPGRKKAQPFSVQRQ